MGFYDLSKEVRAQRVAEIRALLYTDLTLGQTDRLLEFFGDDDTYIRKAAYQAIGKIYTDHGSLRSGIIDTLKTLLKSEASKVRQTVINAAGEIGKADFEVVHPFFDKGLCDAHHSVRNAVIGSIKKMGAKNPGPVLQWARSYLRHPDKEIRREICHGIELRGRTHPQDILPLLETLQFDPTARVRNTLIHVIGQIAYKKQCLETVVNALNGWENQDLVLRALEEIIDVHERYQNFAYRTQEEAIAYIDAHYRHP